MKKGVDIEFLHCYNSTHNKEVMQMFMAYAFTIIATVMDVKTGRISNRLILTGYAISLVLHMQKHGWLSLKDYLLQISFPVIILYLFFLFGVLGAGDIKLFSLISGFIGLSKLKMCVLIAFLCSAIMSFCILLFQGQLLNRIKQGFKYILQKVRGGQADYGVEMMKMPFSIAIFMGLVFTNFV